MDAYNETVPITSADDTSFVISREDANDATKLTIKNRDDTSILAFGGYNHFFEMNLTINRSSRQVCVSVNNTAVGCIDSHAPGATANHEPFHLSFGSHKYFAGGNGLQVNISSFVIINLSLQEAATDTTPPEINQNSYNMTSGGGEGCINWRTDKTNSCITNDTTPTTFFTTNENAFCAVGISNLNYTNLGSSRNCTGGEGTAEHTCTLTMQDELTQENSNIYMSCKDSSGNENLTSTSGALAIKIYAKETGAVQAISRGVQNALLSGYTNYTSQQIYARDLSNNQFTGTFDWIAKKGNKVWAFNYISSGESHVAGTFNLTPVLYVLQLTNTTTQQVTLSVEQTINTTK